MQQAEQTEPGAAMLLLQKISGASSKAGRDGKSRQVDTDLQEIKFKNSDPIPTRPQSMKLAMIKADMQRSKFKNSDPIPTRPP